MWWGSHLTMSLKALEQRVCTAPGVPLLLPRGLDHHWGVPYWRDEAGGRGGAGLQPEWQLLRRGSGHHRDRHVGRPAQPGEPDPPHGEWRLLLGGPEHSREVVG